MKQMKNHGILFLMTVVLLFYSAGMRSYAKEDIDLNNYEKLSAWFEDECEGSLQVLAEKKNDWWERLLPNERTFAKHLESFLVCEDFSKNNYARENITGAISKIQRGIPEEIFFLETCFENLRLQDLYNLRNAGFSLDDLFSFMGAKYLSDLYSCDLYEQYYAWENGELFLETPQFEKLSILNVLAETMRTEKNEESASREAGNFAVVAATGILANGELWGRAHGEVYKVYVNGAEGFSGNYGACIRTGYQYSEMKSETGRIGWIVNHYADKNGAAYVAAQTVIWGLQRGLTAEECEIVSSILYKTSGEGKVIANKIAQIYHNSEGKSEPYDIAQRISGCQKVFF